MNTLTLQATKCFCKGIRLCWGQPLGPGKVIKSLQLSRLEALVTASPPSRRGNIAYPPPFNNYYWRSTERHDSILRIITMHWETLRRRAWKTRSIAEHLNRAADAGGLPKVLSVVDLTFLGFGSIVGAGVYVLSGVTAHSVAG